MPPLQPAVVRPPPRSRRRLPSTSPACVVLHPPPPGRLGAVVPGPDRRRQGASRIPRPATAAARPPLPRLRTSRARRRQATSMRRRLLSSSAVLRGHDRRRQVITSSLAKGMAGESASQPAQGPNVHGVGTNGYPRVVTISRKSILRQITSNIGAVIHTEGIVKLDQNRRIAWLAIEIPSSEDVICESFHGSPCTSDYDAEENVSEVAITYFMTQKSVIINDVHYGAFHATYNQLNNHLTWSHILQTRCHLLRTEKNGLFNAHINLLKRLSLICATYGDILPLAHSPPTYPLGSHVERVTYIGSDPPDTRHEELAQELFNVLQEYAPIGNPTIN